jgi:ABC-2 type transport system permease protein
MIKHIIQQDWWMVRSSPLNKIILALLILFAVPGAWNGSVIYKNRLDTHQSIIAYEAAQFNKLKKNIEAIERAGNVYTGSPFQDPRGASNVAGKYGARYLLYPFQPLSRWVTGQADLYPYYYRVTATKKNGLIFNEEIENPQILFNSSFDLAFVIVYMLPLLIIGFTYNLAGSEKEWGTLRLLLSTPVSFRKILATKFVFRFGLFSTLFLAVLLSIAAISSIPFNNSFFLFAASSVAWIALWFSISLFLNSLINKNSGSTAGALVSAWLLFVLLLPGIFSYVVNSSWPVPSRIQLITDTRAAAEEIKKRSSQVLARYLEDHPEMAKDTAGINPDDFATRFYTAHIETERTIEPLEKEFTIQLQKQNGWVRKFMYFSPAIVMQENLNRISGGDEASYRLFKEQVNTFYKQLQGYYTNRVVKKQNFSAADLEKIPVPVVKVPPAGSNYQAVLYLILASVLFILLSRVSMTISPLSNF